MLRTKLAFLLIGGLIIVSLSNLKLLPNILQQQPVQINILLPALQTSLWEELIEDFEKENPKIRIQIMEAPDATNLVENIYARALAQKESPTELQSYDLVFMDIIWVPELAKQGLLVDLSKKISDKELEKLKADFLLNDWNGGLYKKKLYRIPFHSDIGILYYRKDLLKQVGYPDPPKSFDKLIEISKKLQEKKLAPWGYVWQGMQYEGLVAMFVEILTGYGGFWINDQTGDVGLDKDQAFRAVKFLHDTIANKISSPEVIKFTERETSSVFEKGEAVFLRNWPYVWNEEANLADSQIRDQFDFVPMVHEGNNKSGACQGGWGLGIASSSKHQDEAWKAINFFSSAATQRKYALKTGHMPSRRSLFNDLQLVKRYSYYPKLLEMSQNSVLRPSITKYTEASKILQEHLSSVLKNQTIRQDEIKNEMKDAAIKTRRLLKNPTE